MKKILSLVLIAGFTALIACGPSAEEKAAAEKARQDSINVVMAKMAADSMNAAQALIEKARLDSIMMVMQADSIAKATMVKKPGIKAKPKTTTQKKIEEAKKVTGGRGH